MTNDPSWIELNRHDVTVWLSSPPMQNRHGKEIGYCATKKSKHIAECEHEEQSDPSRRYGDAEAYPPPPMLWSSCLSISLRGWLLFLCMLLFSLCDSYRREPAKHDLWGLLWGRWHLLTRAIPVGCIDRRDNNLFLVLLKRPWTEKRK